ncbi:MAG TPA: type II toxin-antitoxin system VapC family toxin [Rhizomicrobium sp.]
MHGLDTNVLVRFLLRDDPLQASAAKSAIDRAIAAGEPLLIGLLTILETEWVLRARAGLDKLAIVGVFKQLLEARDLLFENEGVLEHALYVFENSNADFADCLMMARYQDLGCAAMLTFDARAAKIPGCELLTA